MKKFLNKNDTKIVLIFFLFIFLIYTSFIALNLKIEILPDEVTHFIFSKHFSTTLGIPPDVYKTYTRGVYIKQNPFLYYWINARIINLLTRITPSLSDWQMLVSLRMVNILYGFGTIIFCFLLSKEFIKHKWWQLFPVFLLTNTTMFVFLTGGVNYDNLTNIFSMAGLSFLARVLNHKNFITNSMAWLACIAAGALTKFTVLPLALVMGIVWIVFFIYNKNQILPLKYQGKKVVVLGLILFFLIIENMAIYGYNLVVYKAIRPPCESILTPEQCALSAHRIRLEEFGLEKKLTPREAVKLGYPGPIKYFFNLWLPALISRIFGIGGYITYSSVTLTYGHIMLFFYLIFVGLIYRKHNTYETLGFLGIFLFYSLVLFIFNYDVELSYGFRTFALQGRYIFPVIGIFYILMTKVLMGIPYRMVLIPTLVFPLILYSIGIPYIIFLFHNIIF